MNKNNLFTCKNVAGVCAIFGLYSNLSQNKIVNTIISVYCLCINALLAAFSVFSNEGHIYIFVTIEYIFDITLAFFTNGFSIFKFQDKINVIDVKMNFKTAPYKASSYALLYLMILVASSCLIFPWMNNTDLNLNLRHMPLPVFLLGRFFLLMSINVKLINNALILETLWQRMTMIRSRFQKLTDVKKHDKIAVIDQIERNVLAYRNILRVFTSISGINKCMVNVIYSVFCIL